MSRRLLPLMLLLAVAAPATAEVGVFRDAHRPDRPRPYIHTVFDVVDEPDPFGVWARYSPVDDTRRIVLEPAGEVTGGRWPALLYHEPWQRAIACWSMIVNGSSRVVVSELADDAWSAPRPLGVSSLEQYDPVLAVDPDGSLVVSYWATDGANRGVFSQTLAAPGDPFSPPVRISPAESPASRPDMVFHGGIAHWVYEVGDAGAALSLQRTRLEDGGLVHEIVAVTARTAALWPEIHSRGTKLWVDWIDFTATGSFPGEMAWQQLDAGGWSSLSYAPFENEEERDFHVRGFIRLQVLAASPDGTVPAAEPAE